VCLSGQRLRPAKGYGSTTASGERISTAAVESMVNRVISRRMTKKMFSGLQVDFCVKLLT
jgi:hypothetical protein